MAAGHRSQISSDRKTKTWSALSSDKCYRYLLSVIKLAGFYITDFRIVKWLYVNLLKPTSHVMHQQFSIQQLYVLPTLYLCVLYLSENKQRLVPLTS